MRNARRMAGAWAVGWLAVAGLAVGQTPRRGGPKDGPIPTYLEVPYVHSAHPEVFRALFARARTETVRLLYLGDSQETTPAGGGAVYVPRLNYEFWRRYGNCPETPFMSANSSTGGGAPYADWLWRGASAAPGPLPVLVPAGWLPPGIRGGRYFGDGPPYLNYGNLVSLQHDAIDIDPGCQVGGTQEFFARGTACRLEVFATTLPESGDVAWQAKPKNGHEPSYFVPVVRSGVLGLATTGATLQVVSGLTDPLPFNGLEYMQVDLYGTSTTVPTQILGSRFRSIENPAGVVVTSFSEGGYKVTDYLARHGQSGPVLAALGFDAVIIGYGANDAASGVTPEAFRDNLETLIAFLRSWMGANLPIIIMTDPYRTGLNPAAAANFDRYAGAAYLMGSSDPALLVVNGRRALEERGWSAKGTPTEFMHDGVHYTPLGARAKAAVEMELLAPYVIDPCYANCDGSTVSPVLNVGDFICFQIRFVMGDPYANCDLSTAAPVLNVADFICFLNRFVAGCL